MNVTQFEVPLTDGSRLAAWHRPRADAPRLLFSHGAGLAVAAYTTFLRRLAEHYDLIAIDLRGHGHSRMARLPETGLIRAMSDDMEAIWEALRHRFGPEPICSVFHSLSGVLALDQVVAFGPRWSAMVLIDPALTPPTNDPLMAVKRQATETMIRRSGGRRATFESLDAYAALLRKRPEFASWGAGEHERFAAATATCPDADGRVSLRVSPAAEAQIYRENMLPELAQAIGRIEAPMAFLCSDPDGPYASPIPRFCASIAQVHGIDFEILPGTTHMLPLERPEALADSVRSFLDRNGAARPG